MAAAKDIGDAALGTAVRCAAPRPRATMLAVLGHGPPACGPHQPRAHGELEALLLRELGLCRRELNHRHFDRLLRQPVLRLVDGRSTLDRWNLPHRSIELSRSLLLQAQWGSVVEVIEHEMAHQYTHEVLQQTDEQAHGPAFRRVCEQMGVDPAAHEHVGCYQIEDELWELYLGPMLLRFIDITRIEEGLLQI